MSSKTPRGFETHETTDASTTEDTPAAIEGPYVPRDIEGGVAIEATAYERTDDEQALRYAGSIVTHIVGLCSEHAVRDSLPEYSRAEIDRAIERGKRLERNSPENASAAIAAAEKETIEAMSAEVATDGGEAHPHARRDDTCPRCNSRDLARDDPESTAQGTAVAHECRACELQWTRWGPDHTPARDALSIEELEELALNEELSQ